MSLTPEQQALGRRNFMKAMAGAPALLGLGALAASRGPVPGGPVGLGIIGLGGQGRVLLGAVDPAFADVRGLCDINPAQLARADEVLARQKRPPAPHYADWTAMLDRPEIEAVLVAVPLWQHAEVTVGCLEAGRHVLCEKMTAWDVDACDRMRQTAARKGRVLEIGYQRFYNPMYHAALDGIVRRGTLGDVYHARLVWHRNGNWRREGTPPTPDYDPSPWGYPTWEHLLNWRLYRRYSRGHLGELGSHQVAVADWFFDAEPRGVSGVGTISRFRDGREVSDHTYVTFEYGGGRTALFTCIESNAFDHYYEAFYGTHGTLILRGEAEAYLFDEGTEGETPAARPVAGIEVTPKSGGPALEASESRAADAAGRTAAGGAWTPGQPVDRLAAYRAEISRFCAALRTGAPLACGIDRAIASARACISADDAIHRAAAGSTAAAAARS